MKKVEIENRSINVGDKGKEFFMVDLIVDGEKIDTGTNPVESYAFWSDLEGEVQRAMYRIKNNNSSMSFDYNLSTMGMTDEQKEERFINYLVEKHPDTDVKALFKVIDAEMAELKMTGPDDNHPNPYMKVPVNGQLVKNIILCVVEKFNNVKEAI